MLFSWQNYISWGDSKKPLGKNLTNQNSRLKSEQTESLFSSDVHQTYKQADTFEKKNWEKGSFQPRNA